MKRGLKHQQGAVLFIALIALVAMALGVLAIQRSLDSATAIAGNIGFRQQGVAKTDGAVEAAVTWLRTAGGLEQNSTANGYYATRDGGGGADMLKFDWANARKLEDADGFQRWYVIHRMCTDTGAPSAAACADSGNTLTQESVKKKGLQGPGGVTPLYRITARTLGPRNSESIVQVMTY